MKNISIILPIYNLDLFYIKRCIDSILSQKYKKWECIIVDDGSSINFNHKNYYQKLLRKDKRFKYFYKKNEGLAMTRNYGFNKSSGDLIWFIDPDDYIRNIDTFDYLIDIYKSHNDIDFINFSYIEINKKNNDLIFNYFKNNIDSLMENKIEFISSNFFNGFRTVWRNVYNRNFLIKNKILHQNKRVLFEDVYFDLLCRNMANKIYISSEVIYFYDKTRSNSIINSTKNYSNIIIENLEEILEFLNSKINDVLYIHLLYFFSMFPLLKWETRKLIYSKYKILKKNNKLNYKEKISFFISKNAILIFIYKLFLYINNAIYILLNKTKRWN